MKAFIIPTWRRDVLLRESIRSVFRLGGTPIVVASEDVGQLPCGTHLLTVPNAPLGAKFNAGWRFARALKPTHVVQWADDAWANEELRHFYDEADDRPFGFEDVYFEQDQDLWYWPGYQGSRPDPIGLGRCVPAALLEQCDWAPHPEEQTNSMDASMHERLGQPVWLKHTLKDTPAKLVAVRTETCFNPLSAFTGVVRV